MSHDPLDELISLYRQGARETSLAHVDERILRLARHSRHRQRVSMVSLGALAAALMLWLAVHASSPRPTAAPATAAIDPAALDSSGDRTRDELLRMDVTPASTPVARYLISEARSP